MERRTLAIFGAIGLVGAAAVLLAGTADPAGTDGRQLFGLWRTRHVGSALLLLVAAAGIACATHSRRLLFVYLLAGMLAVSTLVLLEVAGRLGLVSYPALLGNYHYLPTNALGRSTEAHVEVSGETYMDTAQRWGFEQQPIPFHYRTDARGFRNAEDRDEADVYLLGDSIVVAGLVPFEETMAARLADALGRSVMNVALIGLGITEEHAVFRESALPVEGRTVVQFLFEGNDLRDAAPPSQGRRLARRSFFANFERALQRWTQPVIGLAARRQCEIGGQAYLFHWTSNSFVGLEAHGPALFEAIAAFAAEIRAAGGRYVLAFVPAKLRVVGPACERWPADSDLRDAIDRNPLRAEATAFAAAAGLPFVDLTGPLRAAAAAGEIPWFWGDTHWNGIGHRVAAGALADALRATGAPPDL